MKPSKVIEGIWSWNKNRDERDKALDEGLFIPKLCSENQWNSKTFLSLAGCYFNNNPEDRFPLYPP